MLKTLYFLAIMLTAIALGAGLAHFFELPNKIGLDAQDYLTVQRNYDNWWIVGLVVPLAFLAVFALAVVLRGAGPPFVMALVALGLLIAELVVFWGFVAPVNGATQNWTALPADWEALRAQWEYSHAVRALLYVLALGALVMSALDWRAR
jgi:amino acid permease